MFGKFVGVIFTQLSSETQMIDFIIWLTIALSIGVIAFVFGLVLKIFNIRDEEEPKYISCCNQCGEAVDLDYCGACRGDYGTHEITLKQYEDER